MSAKPLTARETCQVLRDIALGIRVMRRVDSNAQVEIDSGLMTVETDGWLITFYKQHRALDHCDRCLSPEGRAYIFDARQRYGTDPLELLSTWERSQLESLLSLT
ncbi:DUF7693 family protein [Pseudomonas graminis]|uniref:DUF7693 domain-containing protein n=1 Tax=Pseudomonas graminis TaxID=158627 RepID=A0A1I0G6D9_9PSED|nr:hypothetical protein [Pseudomonas graminis]SET66229.1 hypothetical protein SAMN05216197_11986 [Pseudomonas graminis]